MWLRRRSLGVTLIGVLVLLLVGVAGVACGPVPPNRVETALDEVSFDLEAFEPSFAVDGGPYRQSAIRCTSLWEEPGVYRTYRSARGEDLAAELAAFLIADGWQPTTDTWSEDRSELLGSPDEPGVVVLEKQVNSVHMVAHVRPDSADGPGVYVSARESACER